MAADETYLEGEALEAVTQMAFLRHTKKEIEAEEKELRKIIMEALEGADASVGLSPTGTQIVTVTPQVRRQINRSKLEAVYPEVFESVVETATSYIVKVSPENWTPS